MTAPDPETGPETDTIEPNVGDGMTFTELVFSDFLRYREVEPTWWLVLSRCAVLPGLQAMIALRAQQRLFHRGHVRLANIVRSIVMLLWSADFIPGMRVGPGLYLPHPMGVVMGGRTRIGAGVTILQGATAGARDPGGGTHEFATIGDGAIISAHAVLVGGVHVGPGAMVGANSVVVRDVGAGEIVLGVPARKVGLRN